MWSTFAVVSFTQFSLSVILSFFEGLKRPAFIVLIVLLATSSVPDANAQPRINPSALQLDTSYVIGAELPNQDSADDRPCFTLDGKTMYFGSRRYSRDPWRVVDPNPEWKYDSDLWYRIRTDSGWSMPINVGPPINNSSGQLNPTISPRGDELYYVGTSPVLWHAKLVNGKFQSPEPVPGLLNNIYGNRSFVASLFLDSIRKLAFAEMTPDSDLKVRAPDAWTLHYQEHMVSHLKTKMAVDFATSIRCESTISPDNKYGIISENFGKKGEYGMGGMGGEDLWIVPINQEGHWDSLLAPSGNINTEWNEEYPFLAADGVTLYFTSDRPCPTCNSVSGHQHIYVSKLSGAGWSAPKVLPYPINSDQDDYGFSIGPDGQTGYFVSNRSGKSRVYQVRLRATDSAIAPLPVIVMQGRVSDAKTDKPLRAEIFVDDLTSAQNQSSVFSDSLTGRYVLAAHRGHRIGLQAVSAKHLPKSERFVVPTGSPLDVSNIDLALAPEEVGSTLELKNVYFTSGKSILLPESQLELDRIAAFLKKTTNITLEVAGHTDDVGSNETNQTLSEARANAVRLFLIKQGVEPTRLQAVGYGKAKPLLKATTEQARAKNRRVELVITSRTD